MKTLTKYKISLALIIGLLIGISIDTVYHHVSGIKNNITFNRQIDADGTIYQDVRKNDLNYLHSKGNKLAKDSNIIHEENINHFDGYHMQEKEIKAHRIYHPDKYGNYWDWFETHQSLMSDNYDFGNSINTGNNHSGIKPTSKYSGIIANEKVLEKHGVHSGVNFNYWIK